MPWRTAALYIAAQVVGGIIGVWVAHLMFELPVWQVSCTRARAPGQWLAEAVATFGLLLTIFGCSARTRGDAIRGRSLHHRGLLVHGVDVIRQSGRDHRALAVRYFRRHCARPASCHSSRRSFSACWPPSCSAAGCGVRRLQRFGPRGLSGLPQKRGKLSGRRRPYLLERRACVVESDRATPVCAIAKIALAMISVKRIGAVRQFRECAGNPHMRQ